MSKRSNKKERIRNVIQGYDAAVNTRWTIVPLMEHVVAKQPQKINRIFHLSAYIKWILKKQKDMICILCSGHWWVKDAKKFLPVHLGLERFQYISWN